MFSKSAFIFDALQKALVGICVLAIFLSSTLVFAEDTKIVPRVVEETDLTEAEIAAKPAPQPKSKTVKSAYREKASRVQERKQALQAKRVHKKWKKTQEQTKSVFTLSHRDQFVVQTFPTQDNIYIPDASLDTSRASVRNWHLKLSDHFAYKDGKSVILHFETFYYDSREGLIYPNYAFQLNLEVPAGAFKNGRRISAGELRGYLAWAHPDFPKGDLFLTPTSGQVYIWKIDQKTLMGRIDLKFRSDSLQTPIHLYGKMRAYQMTKQEYAASQRTVHQKIAAENDALDRVPIHRDLVKFDSTYKTQTPKNRATKKRSSNLWKSQR